CPDHLRALAAEFVAPSHAPNGATLPVHLLDADLSLLSRGAYEARSAPASARVSRPREREQRARCGSPRPMIQRPQARCEAESRASTPAVRRVLSLDTRRAA